VKNALDEPQTIVLLGGTSDIGLAIVRELIGPTTRHVVLACRDVDAGEAAAAALRDGTITVDAVGFDAAETAEHQRIIDEVADRIGDVDVAIVAFGLLGDPVATTTDVGSAAELATVNFTGAVTSMIAVANVMRRQGHGDLVVLSSVAGERVRRANPVYGGTKAGIDGVAQGLGDALAHDGVHVMIVRPGFVHSAMTDGLDPAPFATTPEVVATVTAEGLRRRRRIVWAPGALRYVFSGLRHVPGPLWRRLPLG
jgi:decaprenylphospho-beta-D-erythro-pentofuranosid-2-ulose 2-reductase